MPKEEWLYRDWRGEILVQSCLWFQGLVSYSRHSNRAVSYVTAALKVRFPVRRFLSLCSI